MVACGVLPPPIRFGRLRRWHPELIDQWLRHRAGLSDTPESNPATRGRPRNDFS
jgi:hypothetical protein